MKQILIDHHFNVTSDDELTILENYRIFLRLATSEPPLKTRRKIPPFSHSKRSGRHPKLQRGTQKDRGRTGARQGRPDAAVSQEATNASDSIPPPQLSRPLPNPQVPHDLEHVVKRKASPPRWSKSHKLSDEQMKDILTMHHVKYHQNDKRPALEDLYNSLTARLSGGPSSKIQRTDYTTTPLTQTRRRLRRRPQSIAAITGRSSRYLSANGTLSTRKSTQECAEQYTPHQPSTSLTLNDRDDRNSDHYFSGAVSTPSFNVPRAEELGTPSQPSEELLDHRELPNDNMSTLSENANSYEARQSHTPVDFNHVKSSPAPIVLASIEPSSAPVASSSTSNLVPVGSTMATMAPIVLTPVESAPVVSHSTHVNVAPVSVYRPQDKQLSAKTRHDDRGATSRQTNEDSFNPRSYSLHQSLRSPPALQGSAQELQIPDDTHQHTPYEQELSFHETSPSSHQSVRSPLNSTPAGSVNCPQEQQFSDESHRNEPTPGSSDQPSNRTRPNVPRKASNQRKTRRKCVVFTLSDDEDEATPNSPSPHPSSVDSSLTLRGLHSDEEYFPSPTSDQECLPSPGLSVTLHSSAIQELPSANPAASTSQSHNRHVQSSPVPSDSHQEPKSKYTANRQEASQPQENNQLPPSSRLTVPQKKAYLKVHGVAFKSRDLKPRITELYEALRTRLLARNLERNADPSAIFQPVSKVQSKSRQRKVSPRTSGPSKHGRRKHSRPENDNAALTSPPLLFSENFTEGSCSSPSQQSMQSIIFESRTSNRSTPPGAAMLATSLNQSPENVSFEWEENINRDGPDDVSDANGSAQSMSVEYEDNAPRYDPDNLSDHQASALLIGCFTSYASQALDKMDVIANAIGDLSVAITANSSRALPGVRYRQNKGKGKMTVTSTSRDNGMIQGGEFARLIRLHVATLLGCKEKTLPHHDNDQGSHMDVDDDTEDSDLDPSYPYPNGPGHPAATAQTLSIMRKMMSEAGVESFRPDFTQPFDSPDNEHLLDLAVKIFIDPFPRFNLNLAHARSPHGTQAHPNMDDASIPARKMITRH
ncbi:hypothetical protein VP01_377g11 [Puccinia sorghi]|uniref:Uncharacterized protein n=1 Tax=Puccinia sorghi TaxID=27349 RepID=A0A0L6UTM3_9BASI|nr:hypothetical protein VP01_377g11 [Puccinia sorghi]